MATACTRHRFILTLAAMMIAATATGVAATLTPAMLAAWRAHVEATEARIERELRSPNGFLVQDFEQSARRLREQVLAGNVIVSEMNLSVAKGREIPAAGGMIQHWRGSVFLSGVTRDALLARLENPMEHGPHQEDVLALKVLNRRPDGLQLFIRMTRRKIVTVTYDTEHRVTFRRHGPMRASSASIATKIVEVDDAGTAAERARPQGEDRGFLWRLNSYWRYEQVSGGVIVELESLTLSRAIPMGLGPIVEPLIDRVARESVARTLENLRRVHTAGIRDSGSGIRDPGLGIRDSG